MAGVTALTPHTALVGVDGWADGRLGDYDGSTVVLNDHVLIEDLAGLDASERLRRMLTGPAAYGAPAIQEIFELS